MLSLTVSTGAVGYLERLVTVTTRCMLSAALNSANAPVLDFDFQKVEEMQISDMLKNKDIMENVKAFQVRWW